MLIIVYSQTEPQDIRYLSMPCSEGRQGVPNTMRLKVILEGLYGVSIFTIEEGGLPFPRSAIKPIIVSATGRKESLDDGGFSQRQTR